MCVNCLMLTQQVHAHVSFNGNQKLNMKYNQQSWVFGGAHIGWWLVQQWQCGREDFVDDDREWRRQSVVGLAASFKIIGFYFYIYFFSKIWSLVFFFFFFENLKLCRSLMIIVFFGIKLRHQSVFYVGRDWILNLLFNQV